MPWAHHDTALDRLRAENHTAPDSNASQTMHEIDRQSPEIRALMNEYGFLIVANSYNDGTTDPAELAKLLRTWRERQQEKLITQTHIDMDKFAASLERASLRLRGGRLHAAA